MKSNDLNNLLDLKFGKDYLSNNTRKTDKQPVGRML